MKPFTKSFEEPQRNVKIKIKFIFILIKLLEIREAEMVK